MQTLSTLPVSIVILATRTHKRITIRLNKRYRDLILWLDYFTVSTVNISLRLTVKIISFLRLTAKCLAVLRLTVNPIETLLSEEPIRRKEGIPLHINLVTTYHLFF